MSIIFVLLMLTPTNRCLLRLLTFIEDVKYKIMRLKKKIDIGNLRADYSFQNIMFNTIHTLFDTYCFSNTVKNNKSMLTSIF